MHDSETPTDFNFTTSGATLKARDGLSDFALVELSSDIPEEWGLVWSGWDRSETVPPYVYGLHHPRGSVMKVSVDYDEPAMTPGGLDDGLVWTIFGWEIGGLQPGSSGSPLLDNNGRIRGQAWYIDGNPICQTINPGGQSSGYGRLNVAWDAKSTPTRRLKEWLDPGNTGALTTDFYPAQSMAQTGGTIQFYKADNFNCHDVIAPAVRLVNNGSQTITSAQLSYSYNNGLQIPLNWTGSLAENQSTIIDLPQLDSNVPDNNVNVTLNAINGVSDGVNGNITTTYSKVPAYTADSITIRIKTDTAAEDISWDLLDENGNIIDGRFASFYQNSQTYNHTLNLDPGCYTFVIRDSYGDGICCSQGNGQYTLSTDSDEIIRQGGNYNSKEYTRFKVTSVLSTDNNDMAQEIIYPNPSSGIFKVGIAEYSVNSTYEIYAITGQKIAVGKLTDTQNDIDIKGASEGIYILKITDASQKNKTFKLVIAN